MIIVPSAPRRAALLRLGVVLAAFVGISLAQGAQCQAGMSMAMTQSVITVNGAAADDCGVVPLVGDRAADEVDHGAHLAGGAVHEPDATMADMAVDGSEPGAPVGIVMACLAVFLALLAALTVLRRGRAAYLVRPVRDVCVPRGRSILPRALTLAELCVLRT